MNRQAFLGTLSAAVVLLATISPSVASQPATDGSFILANMAPPEPEPPAAPEAAPPAAPEAPATTDAPAAPEAPAADPGAPAAPEAAPEAPAAPSEPVAPADQSAPSAGMGSGTMLAIVAAIVAALGAGYFLMRRK